MEISIEKDENGKCVFWVNKYVGYIDAIGNGPLTLFFVMPFSLDEQIAILQELKKYLEEHPE